MALVFLQSLGDQLNTGKDRLQGLGFIVVVFAISVGLVVYCSCLVFFSIDNLTVWQDGTQLLPGVISNRAGGELELLCLGTPGNERVMWHILEVEGPPRVDLRSNFNFYSSGVYDSTMTVNEIGGLTGTFRCESDVSGLAMNFFLSSGTY